MRIAFFLSSDETGGGLNQTKGFLNNISKIKIEHEICIITNNIKELNKINSKNINLLQFKKSFLTKIYFLFIGFISNNKFFSFKFYNPFENFLKKNKIDFIIFSNPSFYSNYCKNIDYAINIWNTEISNYAFFKEFKNGNYEFQNNIIKKSVVDAFRIIVFTEQNKRDLIEFYNCHSEKIIIQNLTPILPNKSKDLKNFDFNNTYKKFDFDKNKRWFFYPAQFWSHKNHIYLLKTIKILIENNNDKVGFIFCGSDKGNLNYIKYHVKNLRLENNIKILGYINDEKLISIYKYCAGIVMPTFLGRSSLPLLEAIFFNKKIYYSKNILDEKLKKFVTEFDLKDPNDLATQLSNFADDGKNNQTIYKDITSELSFEENYVKIINDYNLYLNTWKND